jgi:hypothetical protein
MAADDGATAALAFGAAADAPAAPISRPPAICPITNPANKPTARKTVLGANRDMPFDKSIVLVCSTTQE